MIIQQILISLKRSVNLAISMGCSNSTEDVLFKADIFSLSKAYFLTIMHVRKSELFKQRTKKLQDAIQIYLSDIHNFDKTNMNIVCVDAVHKLHPLDYETKKVDKQYLLDACLRNNQFCNKLHVKCIRFQKCYHSYLNFLRLIKQRRAVDSKVITVPSLLEDFMWHSHMQDPENYKNDMKSCLGFILNHDDKIPKQKLKQYWDDALIKRRQINPQDSYSSYKIKTEQINNQAELVQNC